ncbi:cytochrome c oxidase assembly protein [Frigidibacter sp. MR17.24]|uniref:cytochrome c oxidase assembly protein n=1 Tax=Frigidibacter sp. MR17.24 TaxID=3127345 RepID=UPI003012A7A9
MSAPVRLRAACALAAAAVLAGLWALPLDALMPRFAAHMLRHMGLVAVAAPLIVLAAPALARALAMSPLVAAGVEFVLVWAWHLPGLHGGAYRVAGLFVLEQAMFLVAGLLVWAGCLQAARSGAAGDALAGAGGLLLTSMHMVLLGAVLTLAPRDVYAAACGTVPDPAGQALGGMLMLAIGSPVYLLAGVALAARALRLEEARA